MRLCPSRGGRFRSCNYFYWEEQELKFNKESYEKAKNEYTPAPEHFKTAKKLIDFEEPRIDAAMYHLSMTIKVSLKLLCLIYNIWYAESDDLALLFAKTRGFLRRDILSRGILNMETELLSWHCYANTGVKTADEANKIGKICETFFNSVIRTSVMEMERAFHRENVFGSAGIF